MDKKDHKIVLNIAINIAHGADGADDEQDQQQVDGENQSQADQLVNGRKMMDRGLNLPRIIKKATHNKAAIKIARRMFKHNG